jgi:hypothetical protein
MIDPVALLECTVEQVLRHLTPEEDLGAEGGASVEQLLATALADRLTRLIVDDPGSGADTAEAHDDHLLIHQDGDVGGRSDELARALGACECWGADVRCPVCAGRGAPGWRRPEPHKFASYVQPAIDALGVRDGRPRSTNGHAESSMTRTATLEHQDPDRLKDDR